MMVNAHAYWHSMQDMQYEQGLRFSAFHTLNTKIEIITSFLSNIVS